MAVTPRKRLLVAEDDPDQQEILLEVLTEQGYDVRGARTSNELVRALEDSGEGAPHAVLLDVVGVLGPKVGPALDALLVRPALFLLSGDVSIAEAAHDLHADVFLEKPYDLGDLLERLDVVLRRPRPVQRKTQLRVGV